MKLDFLQQLSGDATIGARSRWCVTGETQRLTDVMLCPPTHLAPVPCCTVTRESLAAGFATDAAAARHQHDALRTALVSLGVRCHSLPAMAGMPDQCFTRDSIATTPWGPVALNPALPHRRAEARHAAQFLASIGAPPVRRVTGGSIEGGDICVARKGLLIIGQSGERTTAEGAADFARPFANDGWEILIAPFDPRHLHLDTLFCMLDERHALAQVEALDPVFLAAVARQGIRLLPVSEQESRELGCNVLSIDGRHIVIRAGQARIAALLRAAGFVPIAVDIGQFAACGGGIHCLTMPLARNAA